MATYSPPGLRLASTGVRAATRSKSSREYGTPASRAIASRCRTPFVEPALAATAAAALSSAARLMICDGLTSSRTSRIASLPASRAASSFESWRAGIALSPPGEMPRNSSAIAIVFAVNCPPQAPAPGHATLSSAWTSLPVMTPAACCPTASKTSWIVTSRPR